MSRIPFGPQLIGETEKTLNAVLCTVLTDVGMTEPQWVTLRLALALADASGEVTTADLAAYVADRAHFEHPATLVADLTERGLLTDGTPTTAGRDFATQINDRLTTITGPIWNALDPDDVTTAARVLNTVRTRARAVLA